MYLIGHSVASFSTLSQQSHHISIEVLINSGNYLQDSLFYEDHGLPELRNHLFLIFCIPECNITQCFAHAR